MSTRRIWLTLAVALAACGRSGLDDLLPSDSTVGAAGTGAAGTAGGTAGTSGAAGTAALPVFCPCSRAPGGRPTSSGVTCPAGTGRSQEMTIGTTGGSLTLATATGRLVLAIPAGALSSSTSVRVTELARPTPASYTDYSAIYEVTPGGLQLGLRARFEILWNFVLAPGSRFTSPAEVAIYFANSPNGPWSALDDSVVNAGSSIATLDRFGYLFVGYPSSLDDPTCSRAP